MRDLQVISRDVTIRSYLTAVGTSSLEVRTDSIQTCPQTGAEHLVNVCHTIMVALDAKTMRPAKGCVPPLELEPDPAARAAQEARAATAERHAAIRKARAASTMQLRAPISAPPTAEEMRALHELHRADVRLREAPPPRAQAPRTVGDLTFSSSFVIFPESRNVHGKLFGGYVMAQVYNLALFTAKVSEGAKSNPNREIAFRVTSEANFSRRGFNRTS